VREQLDQLLLDVALLRTALVAAVAEQVAEQAAEPSEVRIVSVLDLDVQTVILPEVEQTPAPAEDDEEDGALDAGLTAGAVLASIAVVCVACAVCART